ncbi:MAG: hypothetical protein M3517_04470 [Actinomycetota bacterium]|nr:hypothetical protein [Actinomycetota bacterium]
MRTGAIVATGLTVIALVGCRDDAQRARDDRAVASYAQVVREVAAPDGAFDRGPRAGDDRPVVYAVGLDGESIDPGVQAEVAKLVHRDIDLRFADDADEVFLDDGTVEVVRGHGVLIELGPMPDGDTDDFTVDGVWSRTRGEVQQVRFHLRDEGDAITLTSTAMVD